MRRVQRVQRPQASKSRARLQCIAMETSTSRQAIARAVERTPDILFATLFGSRVGGRARADSDWDIAIYLDERLGPREREAIRARLIAALEPATPVDVVILNDAPALLARRALDGDPIVVSDRRAWVRFFVRTLAAAGDDAFWQRIHADARERRLAEGRFGRS
jgi:predicted nucleotidyltransferase